MRYLSQFKYIDFGCWKVCLIVAVLVVFGVGCTSVKVSANKDQTSVRKIERLFVLIRHGEVEDQKFSNEVALAFRNAMTNSGLALQIKISSPVELDEKAHLQHIQESQSDSVLVITATGGVINEFGGYPTIIYDASLNNGEASLARTHQQLGRHRPDEAQVPRDG